MTYNKQWNVPVTRSVEKFVCAAMSWLKTNESVKKKKNPV